MDQRPIHRPPSLFGYLLLRVLPVATIVMMAMGFVGLEITKEIAEKTANDVLERQSKQTTTVIQARLENILSQTRNLAENGLLVNSLIDVEGRQEYLPTFFQSLRLAGFPHARVEMTDYKGRLIVSNMPEHKNHTSADVWHETVSASGVAWSGLTPNGFVAVEPIRYLGNAEGSIVTWLNNEDLPELFDVGVQYGDTVLVDASGRVIYSSNTDIVTADLFYSDSESENWLVVTNKLEKLPGIAIKTLHSRDDALASQQWMLNFLIGGIVVALLVLGAAISLTAFITRRDVSRLSAVAENIGGTEDLDQRVVPSGPAEIFDLSNNFNRMLETLQQTTTSYEYVDSIVTNTAEGIITTDPSGIIETFNQASARMFGYTVEEAIGRNISMLIPVDKDAGQGEGTLFHPTDVTGTTEKLRELNGRRKDGSQFPMELNLDSMHVGGNSRIIGIIRDISERKRFERELVENQQRAETANNAKSEFLASMSHELRTPMNAILGFAQILEFDPGNPLTDKQKSHVAQIMKGGNHLLELIDQVLDLARIESGNISLSLEEVELANVCGECLELTHKLATQNGLRVSADLKNATSVIADYTRLKQVLLNLLSNAVKYNRDGGQITLECTSMPDNRVRVLVTDTGDGIAAEQLDVLFEPFNRLGKETGEIEGTGIGLTITKQLVEAMGANIGVDSTVGVGSTFWVEFESVSGMSAKAAQQEEIGTVGINQKRSVAGAEVLYIEDNPANVQLMESLFDTLDGVSLIHAPDAESGLVIAQHLLPNLILMDVNLPGMSGIEALKQLRTNSGTRDIPVIAVSARAMKTDVEKGAAAGFSGYVTKPFNLLELTEIILKELDAKGSMAS